MKWHLFIVLPTVLAIWSTSVTAQDPECTGVALDTACQFSQCQIGICAEGRCFATSVLLGQQCVQPGNITGVCDTGAQCVDPASVVTGAPVSSPTNFPSPAPSRTPTAPPTVITSVHDPRPTSCAGLQDGVACILSGNTQACIVAACAGEVCVASTLSVHVSDGSLCPGGECVGGSCGPVQTCDGHQFGTPCDPAQPCRTGICISSSTCAHSLLASGSSCQLAGMTGTCDESGVCELTLSPTVEPSTLAPTTEEPSAAPTTGPTTAVPTSAFPTSVAPSTAAPTTIAPTTPAPTTQTPTTSLVAQAGETKLTGRTTIFGVPATAIGGTTGSLHRLAFTSAVRARIQENILVGFVQAQVTGLGYGTSRSVTGARITFDATVPSRVPAVISAIIDSLQNNTAMLHAVRAALPPARPLRNAVSCLTTDLRSINLDLSTGATHSESSGNGDSDGPSDDVVALIVVVIIIMIFLVLGIAYYYREQSQTGKAELSTITNPLFPELLGADMRTSPAHKMGPSSRGSTHIHDDKLISLTETEVSELCSDARLPAHAAANGTDSVLPYNATRVRLQPLASRIYSDYVNASFVATSPKNVPYIIAATPVVGYAEEFWRLIFEQQCSTIIAMDSPQKSDTQQYLPLTSDASVGSCVLKELTCTKSGTYTQQDISMVETLTGASRIVKHFQYHAWPAEKNDVPEDTHDFLNFYKMVSAATESDSAPILIHCRSGAGASAIFAMLDSCLKAYQKDQDVSVHDVCIKFRQCRQQCLQNAEQYKFVLKAIVDMIQTFPPKPITSVSKEVREFLGQFSVPSELAPFDIGIGGRKILRIGNFKLADNTSVIPVRLVICNDVILLCRIVRNHRDAYQLMHAPMSRDQVKARILEPDSIELLYSLQEPSQGCAALLRTKGDVLRFLLGAGSKEDAETLAIQLNSRAHFCNSNALQGARLVPFAYATPEQVAAGINVTNVRTSSGNDYANEAWEKIPTSLAPNVSLVPLARQSKAQPLSGGFTVNPVYGAQSMSPPKSPGAVSVASAPLLFSPPPDKSQIATIAQNRMAYAPRYTDGLGVEDSAKKPSLYLPSLDTQTDLLQSSTGEQTTTFQNSSTPVKSNSPLRESPEFLSPDSAPNNSFRGQGTPAYYPHQAQAVLERAKKLLNTRSANSTPYSPVQSQSSGWRPQERIEDNEVVVEDSPDEPEESNEERARRLSKFAASGLALKGSESSDKIAAWKQKDKNWAMKANSWQVAGSEAVKQSEPSKTRPPRRKIFTIGTADESAPKAGQRQYTKPSTKTTQSIKEPEVRAVSQVPVNTSVAKGMVATAANVEEPPKDDEVTGSKNAVVEEEVVAMPKNRRTVAPNASKWKNFFESTAQKHADSAQQPDWLRDSVAKHKERKRQEQEKAAATAASKQEDAKPSTAANESKKPVSSATAGYDLDEPPYAHTGLDRKAAEAMLVRAGAEEGDFLVRVRDIDRNEYTLVIIFKGIPTHHAIQPGPDGELTVNKMPCPGCRSIGQVVERFRVPVSGWPVVLQRGIEADASPASTHVSAEEQPPVNKQSVNTAVKEGSVVDRGRSISFLPGEKHSQRGELSEAARKKQAELEAKAEERKREARRVRKELRDKLHAAKRKDIIGSTDKPAFS